MPVLTPLRTPMVVALQDHHSYKVPSKHPIKLKIDYCEVLLGLMVPQGRAGKCRRPVTDTCIPQDH